ncbi:hypothetical protein, partial [Bacillus sp. SIMBA_033]|uniref:hypothetical protein n=1 Tax=Bacillus sp. SIMBA_033 TaxID=3085776 RepID=UPI00397C2863
VSGAQRQFDVFLSQSAIKIASLRFLAALQSAAAHHNPLQFQCFSVGKPMLAGFPAYVTVARQYLAFAVGAACGN